MINEIEKISVLLIYLLLMLELHGLMDQKLMLKAMINGKIVDCDLNGVYYCAHTVGQIFKKNKSGSLIITSSMSGTIVNIPQLKFL